MAISKERIIKAYPRPQIIDKLNSYSTANEMSKSKVVSMALKQFFDRQPLSEIGRVPTSKNSY